VEFLVRALPKDLRKACQPVAAFVDEFTAIHRDAPVPSRLSRILADEVQKRVRYKVPESDVMIHQLPPEWQVKCWVCDDEGSELALGTDIGIIRNKLEPLLKNRLEEHANDEWFCSGLLAWPIEEIPVSVESTGGHAYPALVDEGKSIGVRAYHCRHLAAQSHRAGCARLLMIIQSDQPAYLTKNFPLGLSARVELPRLGQGGTSMEDCLMLAAEGALGTILPRSATEFAAQAAKAKGAWYESASSMGKSLDALVDSLPTLREWIHQQRNSKFLAAVADDLEEELSWLTRTRFAWRTGHERLKSYPRLLQAMQMRIARLQSLPIIKDLEKMDRVRALWAPWFRAWNANPDDPALWDAGWLLEEWRVTLFAPTIPAMGGISEKKIRLILEELGVLSQ
jgi:ATP-dependent helicase HrpA